MSLTMEELTEFRAEIDKRDAAKLAEIRKEAQKEADQWKAQVLGRFDQLQQARMGPSFCETLTEHKALTDRPKIAGQGTHVNFDVPRKVITGISVQVPQWTGDIAPLPMPAFGVRRLIPIVPTTQGSVEIIKKTSYDNQAAPVAEGAQKPESAATYVPVTIPVEKVAHWVTLTKETYDDLPALVSELQLELIWGVQKIEEGELLKGSGTRPHLNGIYTNAPAAPSMPLGTSLVDQVGAGMGVLTNLGYQPNGVIVNGADWNAVQRSRTVPDGQYLMGPPTATPQNVVWGVPVIISSAMAPGEWLVGDFRRGARLHERESVNVTIATENQDDFIKNLVTALCEMREALVIREAQAFLKNGVLAAQANATARK